MENTIIPQIKGKKKGELRSEITVVLVDDDDVIRNLITKILTKTGWNVIPVESAVKAINLTKKGIPDILISDVYMPDLDGIKLLKKVKEISKDLEVIIMTGFSEETLAIRALKAGAFDYLPKPFGPAELQASLIRTNRYQNLIIEHKRLQLLDRKFRTEDAGKNFMGDSHSAKQLFTQIQKVSASPNVTVLLTGESGVGKEVAARWIHGLSRGTSDSFVPVNCGGFAESLLESELFGHEAGAYTGAEKTVPGVFEMARGGTILLDEISEMSYEAQSRFLRVLEDRRFRRLGGTQNISIDNTRFIAATNKDLEQLVSQGKFRQDLYFRIKVATITIPPLRERIEDIIPLANHFLETMARKKNGGFELTPSSARSLLSYNFPGNIRELRNILERSCLFAKGREIDSCDLDLETTESERIQSYSDTKTPKPIQSEIPLNLSRLEKFAIRKALSFHANDKSKAALELGISTQSLYRKIKKHRMA